METLRTGPAGETIDASRHRALCSDNRVAVPRLIRTAHSGLTAGEVAESVGLRLSTAARVVRLPDVRPRGDQR